MPLSCPRCQSELPPGALHCPRCLPRVAAPTALQSIGERGTLPTEAPPAEPETYGDLIFEEDAPAAQAPAGLDPELSYLLQLQPGGGFRPWPLHRPYHSVGRDGAKIALADPRVSRRHLSVARVGPGWLAVNRSSKSMSVGGRRLRQKTLRKGDVVRIGHTWLAFAEATVPGPPLRAMAGKLHPPVGDSPGGHLATLGSLDEEEAPAHCALSEGGRLLASSDGTPVLVGSHPTCDCVLSGPGVAAFHALLSWLPDGLHLLDLDSGWGTLLDGAPVRDVVVRDGQVITLGGRKLTARLAGDACAPAAERERLARGKTPALALSAIFGPHAGETALLPAGRPVILGSASTADLALPAEKLAAHQLELTVGPGEAGVPVLRVRPLADRPGAVINRQPLTGPHTAVIGDVIQFGTPEHVAPAALLVHLDLSLEAWAL